ncbi:hypothetical protein GY655_26535, partial [Escherichia coli]|nr:hypothetical protein [Escherichia coli]
AAAAGLGVAAKLLPIVMLPLLVLSAFLEHGRSWWQRVVRTGWVKLAAIGAWLAVNLPIALLAPHNWSEFYLFSQSRNGTAAATWDVLGALGI